ncbi:MAG: 2-methylcitrate dehydratase [Rhodobacteraceae bacterium]|nr:2-methylcitrate dehydratase [Paracoccaceae bacterium]
MTTLYRPLAAFASASAAPDPLALRIARLSAIDWMAVGLAGRDEDAAKILRGVLAAEAGQGAAHGFGLSAPLPARDAAWLNGTTSHALDYDDTHFAHIGHPSVAVFPAAMAMGEAQDMGLSKVIEAALIGMELSVRVGLWLGRDHYQVGFHQTATAGAFGATAAAGRLAGLTGAAMEQALGLAATQAAGLKAQFGTMGKPLNAGLAARTGVEAAVLVAGGFTSSPEALDGPFGFGATHHGAADGQALDGLGDTWLFEQVSHKFHACCHGLHAALEALRDLDLAGPEIARLTVHTHPRWMSVCNQPAPTTGLGAKFSYRTALAMALAGHDTARLDTYTEALCTDPAVIALRDRIEVQEDASLDETQARLDALLRNGARKQAEHDLNARVPIDAREHRVLAKAAALVGDKTVGRITQLIDSDAPARDLGALMVV